MAPRNIGEKTVGHIPAFSVSMHMKKRTSRSSRALPTARERERAKAKLTSSHFSVIALGSRELLGLAPKWERVVERLQKYSLAQVLEVLGRMSIVLNQLSQPAQHERAQLYLLRGVLGVGSGAARGLGKWLQSRDGAALPWALFHERQIINATKAAFLALPVSDAPGSDDLTSLGEALLMIGNLVEQGSASIEDHDVSTEIGRREWEQFLFANPLSNSRGVELHDIARGYLLYHTDRPHLRSKGGPYVDLPRTFERITGVPSDALWQFLQAFNSRWQAMNIDELYHSPSSINVYQYFTSSGIFTTREVDALLSLTAKDAHILKKEVEADYSLHAIRPYSTLPLARSPVVMINARAYVPSVQLLQQKLVRGTHHFFLDPNLVPDSKERKGYLDYLGRVFEDYIDELLARTYSRAIGKYVPETVLKQYISGRVCDGLIHAEDTVVLVEAKAKLFAMSSREWEGWDQYLSKLENVFVGSAQQIDSTIASIRSGRLVQLGLDPRRIRTYLPLVVTLEDSTMNYLQYGRIKQMVRNAGLLTNPDVLPIQTIDVGELELWEIGVGLGKKMHARLREKATSPDSADLTFGNYLVQRGDTFVEKKNPYLLDVFEQLTERTLADFRARRLVTNNR